MPWRRWLSELYPAYTAYPFAQRHIDFWQWVWSVSSVNTPAPFIAIWPRGGAKSTSAELGTIALGTRKDATGEYMRRYALYISGTQDQADKHVGTIGEAMESIGIKRALNVYGTSIGWRRNRLSAENGFTVDALGLDSKGFRGIKKGEQRPDLIVLDDIDDLADSGDTVRKKIATITQSILPSGAPNLAVMGAQNIIHSNGVFARMVSGNADFLTDRVLSGPFPAVHNAKYEQTTKGIKVTGTASWEGQSIATCEAYIRRFGLHAFRRECQHDVQSDVEGALWSRKSIEMGRLAPGECPELSYVTVAVDPSASSHETSDEAGINVSGRSTMKHGYVLADWSLRGTPAKWASRAVCAYIVFHANHIVGEGNNGGEMVGQVIYGLTKDYIADELESLGYPREWAVAGKQVPFTLVYASKGKATRAEPVSRLYELGQGHHVGMFPALEDEMCTWIPGNDSPNRMDALVWAMKDLGLAVLGHGWADYAEQQLAAGAQSPIDEDNAPQAAITKQEQTFQSHGVFVDASSADFVDEFAV